MPSSLCAVRPPRRVLMGPGPSEVPAEVLQALAAPTIGHLDPAFLRIMDELQQMLRQVFRTSYPLTLAVSGTGSAGMETVLVNLIEPGDPVVICVQGVFGNRMVDIAQRCGAEVTRLERAYGEVFHPEEIAATLRTRRFKLLAIVHAETSTGACQPLPEIARLCHEHECLFVVDSVTSLAGLPVEVEAWGLDAVYSGTQKCLSCPPGLAPVTFSPRAVAALDRRRVKVASWYLDLQLVRDYWGTNRAYHHTAPINMNYALHTALRLVLEEGLEARWARHQQHHAALRAGIEALGLEYAVPAEHRLPMLNAIRIPAGVDDLAVRRQLLEEFGIEIGGGLGPWKGQVWRVGLMGASATADHVLLFLSALEHCLRTQGYRCAPGSGVSAASEHYRQTTSVTAPS
ncbi:MAG: serine--pyruvate aminotransferase [Planctomycetaceae bacterium]|nr:MAG: serine--pyruvate aminotransferase [Planctomycetaceae bacterium]